MVKQTRFKLALAGLLLGLLESFIKTLFASFPLVELYAFQGAILGYFFTVKTISDAKEIANGKDVC